MEVNADDLFDIMLEDAIRGEDAQLGEDPDEIPWPESVYYSPEVAKIAQDAGLQDPKEFRRCRAYELWRRQDDTLVWHKIPRCSGRTTLLLLSGARRLDLEPEKRLSIVSPTEKFSEELKQRLLVIAQKADLWVSAHQVWPRALEDVVPQTWLDQMRTDQASPSALLAAISVAAGDALIDHTVYDGGWPEHYQDVPKLRPLTEEERRDLEFLRRYRKK